MLRRLPIFLITGFLFLFVLSAQAGFWNSDRATTASDGPKPTPTGTMSLTPSLTPSTTLAPCPPFPTQMPTGSGGGDRNEPRTTPCPPTHTPTYTPSLTPSKTLEPCAFLPAQVPAVGVTTPRTTPCPPTNTPTAPRQPVQLLFNPDFDDPFNRLMNWSVDHLPATRPDDKARTDDLLDVFMFRGGRDEKSKLKQVIGGGSMPFELGDSLHLFVSYRNKGPQPAVLVKLTFKYGDGTPASVVKIPITELTDSYRTLSAVLPIASTRAGEIAVTLINKSPKNKTRVFIDRVELWWMPAP